MKYVLEKYAIFDVSYNEYTKVFRVRKPMPVGWFCQLKRDLGYLKVEVKNIIVGEPYEY